MRSSLLATLLFLPLLLFMGPGELTAQEADVAGTWEISWETRLGETHTFTVTLEDHGETMEGTAEIPTAFFTGEGGAEVEEFQVLDADTHGHMVTFKIQPMHPHHQMMRAPEEMESGEMHPHTIAVYAAVDDTEMEGYMTGVMPRPETAVPFEGTKRY